MRPLIFLDLIRRTAHLLGSGVVILSLFLSVSIEHLWAQVTMHTWTDMRGVVHYSNQKVPTQFSDRATLLVFPRRLLFRESDGEGSGSIPLVLLNNDPSRKYVRTVLQGVSSTKKVLMIVDTGSTRTLIGDDLAQELGVEYVQDVLLSGVIGSARGWVGRLPALRMGTIEVLDLHVFVAPVAGLQLLGMDVLGQLALSVGPHSLEQTK